MNYETKIYLDKLIEAVSSTDWWSIGITAVNALIVVALTIWQLCLNKKQTIIQERQNKLQEQQNKLQEQQIRQQEYDTYRRLYSVIYSIDELSLNLLNIIDRYLSNPLVRASDKKILFHTQEKAMQLVKDLDNNAIDFDLKFSNGRDILDKYKKALVDITSILQYFISLEIDGHIALTEDSSLIYKLTFQEDEDVIINSIKNRIKTISLISPTVGVLNGYIEIRDKLLTIKIAEEIKKRITPIDA